MTSTDDAGWTALMHAVQGGHETVVRLLMDAGASVHLQNDAQETALHLAAQYGRTEAARLLLEADADFAARDADGRTPLFRAIGGGHVPRSSRCCMSRRWPAANRVSPGATRSPRRATRYISHGHSNGRVRPTLTRRWRWASKGTVVLIVLVRQDGSVGAANVSESLEDRASTEARCERLGHGSSIPATRAGEPVVSGRRDQRRLRASGRAFRGGALSGRELLVSVLDLRLGRSVLPGWRARTHDSDRARARPRTPR